MITKRPTATLTGLLLMGAACFPVGPALSQTAPPQLKPAVDAAAEVVDAVKDRAAAPTVTATLDRVAAGAEVVVVIPSLSELSEAIAGFGAETGLDRLAPEFADTLGAFKRQMNWRDGVDDEGAMLVVVTGLADAIDAELAADNAGGGEAVEPSAVLLVPVSDYKALVAQLGGDPGADTTAVTFQNLDGRTNEGFAKSLDGYAVLSDTIENVSAYTDANQGKAITAAMGGMVSEYLNGGDSLILIDMAVLAPSLNKAIDKAIEEFDAQMKDPNNGMPAGLGGTVDAAISLYARTGRTLVNGTDKLLLSLDFADGGLGLTTSAQMKDGTELAGFFKPNAQQGDAKSGAALLATLPDQPYIYAASIDATQFALDRLIDQLMDALGDDGDAGIMTMYKDSIAMMKDAQGVASVFYAPDTAAMMAGGFYTSLTVYDVADADTFVKQQKECIEQLGEISIDLPAAQEGQPAQQMTFNTQYTEKALVIEGVEVDQYQVNTILPPEMMQQFGPMAALMGNSGTGGYIAVKDGKVLISTVTDPQLITRGLKALGQQDGAGSGGAIAQVRSDLPADSSMELFISLDGIAQTANQFLSMMAPEYVVEVPADLPPLAMGGASDGKGVALRMFVPHELVKFTVDSYEQLAPPPQNGQGRDGAPRAPRAY